MKLQKKQHGRATSMAYGLMFGTMVSLTITLISTVLLAKLVDKEILPWENIGYGIVITVLIASFAGAFTSYSKIQHQRLVVCLVTGAAYWSILFIIASLPYGGNYQGVLITSVIILIGSITAFLVSAPRRHRTPSGKYRIAHR